MKKSNPLLFIVFAGLLLFNCSSRSIRNMSFGPVPDSKTAVSIAQTVFAKDLGQMTLLLKYTAVEIEEGNTAVWFVCGVLLSDQQSRYPFFRSAGVEIQKKTGKILYTLYDKGPL